MINNKTIQFIYYMNMLLIYSILNSLKKRKAKKNNKNLKNLII